MFDNINKQNTAASILSFDFSNLYTNMHQNKIFNLLYELIDFSLQPKKGEYRILTKIDTKWTEKDKQSSVTFTKKLKKVQSFC